MRDVVGTRGSIALDSLLESHEASPRRYFAELVVLDSAGWFFEPDSEEGLASLQVHELEQRYSQ
jgi:hypothetical protein